MADKYREIRRTPPLLVHFGNVSTLAASEAGKTSPVQADRSLLKANMKLNKLKDANPSIDYIKTNMTQWGNNSVAGSYSSTTEAVQKKQHLLKVFWGKFVPGDIVDVKLSTAAKACFIFVPTFLV